MVYETFLETLTQQLRQVLGESHQITLQKIPKNNGILLDSLSILSEHQLISPTIHLAPYYETYCQGAPLAHITEDILKLYHASCNPLIPNYQTMSNFSKTKEKIVYKLVHFQSNRELLKEIPHKPFLDLAIIFYLLLDDSEQGQLTSIIYYQHLELWNITLDDLFLIATQNTPRLLPPKIQPMEQVMTEIFEDHLSEQLTQEHFNLLITPKEPQLSLYVLTNSCGFCGSCCILYGNVLFNFAVQQNCDLIILPSSIHEVLLIPYETRICLQDLRNMVIEINHTEVPLEDQLSNQIYLYSLHTNSIDPVFSDCSHPSSNLPN